MEHTNISYKCVILGTSQTQQVESEKTDRQRSRDKEFVRQKSLQVGNSTDFGRSSADGCRVCEREVMKKLLETLRFFKIQEKFEKKYYLCTYIKYK